MEVHPYKFVHNFTSKATFFQKSLTFIDITFANITKQFTNCFSTQVHALHVIPFKTAITLNAFLSH